MNEIFASIQNKLANDLSVEVYDHVDQNTEVFPYVVVKPLQAVNSDTDDNLGFSAIIEIHVWSEYRGSKEAAELQQEIYRALHRWDMPDTTTYAISDIMETFRRIDLDPDAITRHGVQGFQIYFNELIL